MSDLDVIREAVEHDLEPSIAELIGPSSAALYARTRAAARRFLALTETGRQVRYCIEHQALIGALPYLCNVANWVIDGGGSPADCRIVPKLLADYLTEKGFPMTDIDLTDTKKYTDTMLIKELQRRGRLKVERQTKHIVGGHLEMWEKYSTDWLVVDEVSV